MEKSKKIKELEQEIVALQKLSLDDGVLRKAFNPDEEFQEIKKLFDIYK